MCLHTISHQILKDQRLPSMACLLRWHRTYREVLCWGRPDTEWDMGFSMSMSPLLLNIASLWSQTAQTVVWENSSVENTLRYPTILYADVLLIFLFLLTADNKDQLEKATGLTILQSGIRPVSRLRSILIRGALTPTKCLSAGWLVNSGA